MFDILGSDIVVMQELKIQRKDLRDDMVLLEGWDCYFSLPKHKKGYSGVGIYTRNDTCAPVKAEEGLLGVLPSPSGVPYCELAAGECIGGYPSTSQIAELGVDPAMLDAEGRCLLLEFPAFVLLGVYSPANSNGLRDDFRYGFICALDCRIRNLVRGGKRVVLVGDLNVSRDEWDTASATDDIRKAGITHADYISTPNRRLFNQLLVGGEVVDERDEGREEGILWDTCRAFHPNRKGMYTHWEQKINARPGNFGSRIDFVLVSKGMQSWVKDANIQEGLLGSDHCPVFADFHDVIELDGRQVHLIDIMNPAGTFTHGVRKCEWKIQFAPAFSAKRLPEFDKRRSIKSMFAAPSLRKMQSSTREEIGCPAQNLASEQDAADGLSNTDSAVAAATDSISEKIDAKPSPLKRGAPGLPNGKPSKRTKTENARPPLKGQQSLKGFFQRSIADEEDALSVEAQHEPNGSTEATITYKCPQEQRHSPLRLLALSTEPNVVQDDPGESRLRTEDQEHALTSAEHQSPSPAEEDDLPSATAAKLAAVEQTQKSWNVLFSRPIAPMCEGHNEPCKTMQTKKKGSNQGRSFWMCARPLGPSGNKERGSQWRCPTFIWCSDWSTRREDGNDAKRVGD